MNINEYCKKIISQNPDQVDLYKDGKAALGFLVGRVMKECQGSENPMLVMEEMLDEKIK